jgi:hypothetical protein
MQKLPKQASSRFSDEGHVVYVDSARQGPPVSCFLVCDHHPSCPALRRPRAVVVGVASRASHAHRELTARRELPCGLIGRDAREELDGRAVTPRAMVRWKRRCRCRCRWGWRFLRELSTTVAAEGRPVSVCVRGQRLLERVRNAGVQWCSTSSSPQGK